MGNLKLLEVYFEHDGPKVFSARSLTTGETYLATCVDEDEETDTFLYVKVPYRRYALMRSGRLSMRDIFTLADLGDVWRVVADFSSDDPQNLFESVDPQTLGDDDLPTNQARLKLATASLPEFEVSELRDWSNDEYRPILAVELDRDSGVTEFPLKDLSRIGANIQSAMDALGQEAAGSPTIAGVIPGDVTREVEMSLVGLRAASFVIVLGATTPRPELFPDSTILAGALRRFRALVETSSDAALLIDELRQYGRRARSRFRELLQALRDADTGISIYEQMPQREVVSASANRVAVRQALQSIDNVKPSTEVVNVQNARLTALNLTRRTFEIFDRTNNISYSGRFSESLVSQVNGLRVGHDQIYQAQVEVENQFAADEEVRPRYNLISIEPLASFPPVG